MYVYTLSVSFNLKRNDNKIEKRYFFHHVVDIILEISLLDIQHNESKESKVFLRWYLYIYIYLQYIEYTCIHFTIILRIVSTGEAWKKKISFYVINMLQRIGAMYQKYIYIYI